MANQPSSYLDIMNSFGQSKSPNMKTSGFSSPNGFSSANAGYDYNAPSLGAVPQLMPAEYGFGGAPKQSLAASLAGLGQTGGAEGALGALKEPGFMDSFKSWGEKMGLFGTTDTKTGIKTDGSLESIIGAGSALMKGFVANEQLGVARDTLASNKQQFALNYGNKVKDYNRQLSDIGNSREAATSGRQSASAYINDNRIG
jgi:hypothetical protein